MPPGRRRKSLEGALVIIHNSRWRRHTLRKTRVNNCLTHSAILDGKICCPNADATSNFKDLLFRREWPFFVAFALRAGDREDLRSLALITPPNGSSAHPDTMLSITGQRALRIGQTVIEVAPKGPEPSAVISLVATVGTVKQYPFHRLRRHH
jgi:hypothetical protein